MKRILTKIANSISAENESIVYNLDIQENEITLDVVLSVPTSSVVLNAQNEEEIVQTEKVSTLINVKIPLEAIKNSKRMKSNTLVGLFPKRPAYRDASTQTVAIPNDIINISQLTLQQRAERSTSGKISNILDGVFSNIHIFVRDPNGTFLDHDIIVIAPGLSANFTLNSNVEFVENDTYSHLDSLDPISVEKDTDYSNSDYDRYIVTSSSYVDSTYVEPVVGILDRTKISMTNGTGYFRVLKSSIDDDQFKARVGFYSYPGLVDVS